MKEKDKGPGHRERINPRRRSELRSPGGWGVRCAAALQKTSPDRNMRVRNCRREVSEK